MTRKAKFSCSYIKEALRIYRRYQQTSSLPSWLAAFAIPDTPHEFFAGNRRCDHDHEENVNVELQHL